MSSATSSLFKLAPMAINSSLSSHPNLFITKPSYPFLSLPLKPTQLIHISSFSSKKKLSSSFSSVIPFVAQTSDWAQQDSEVVGEAVEDSVEEESGEEDSFQEPSEDAKLFVGNLPYDMTSEQLAQIFEKAGVVNISEVIYNRDTDQSRGFAFVTMDNVEEAEKAVEMFNGYDINGRLLTVNKAAPRGSRPERPAQTFESSFRLYVGNLPWEMDNSRLEQVFGEHGNVVDARVLYDRETGRSRGFGFVTMSSQTEVDNAISALDGQSVEGRNIRVNVAEERPRRNSF